MAFSVRAARDSLRVHPRSLVGWGLLLALLAAVAPLFVGKPLFTSLWQYTTITGVGAVELGSPLAFDVGVYLVVAGATLLMLFALEEG